MTNKDNKSNQSKIIPSPSKVTPLHSNKNQKDDSLSEKKSKKTFVRQMTFIFIKSILRLFIMSVALIVSTIGTFAFYKRITDNGSRYTKIFQQNTSIVLEEDWEEIKAEGSCTQISYSCEFDIRILKEENFRAVLSIQSQLKNGTNLTSLTNKGEGVFLSLKDISSIGIWPPPPPSLYQDKIDLPIIELTRPFQMISHVRDLNLNLPLAALKNTLVINMEEVFSIHSENEFDEEIILEVATKISDVIYKFHKLDTWQIDNPVLVTSSGGLQFASLFLSLLSLSIFIISFIGGDFTTPKWHKVYQGILANVPFLGFLGTLIGMASATQILGSSDLSDDTQRAVDFGPIGSKISLALETSKFALICFLCLSIIFLTINFIFGRHNQLDD